MNREEYLAKLKNLLQSLTLDEQNEALQYYSDYFDEADDDQKVISELGTPEELAESITQKLANAVAKKDSDGGSGSESSSEESGSFYKSDSLFYSYEAGAVKSVDLNFGTSEVVFIPGEKFTVETRGIDKYSFQCSLDKLGVLVVRNVRKLNLDFWNHDRRRRIVPRILITIPGNASFERFRLTIGAGKVTFKDTYFSCFSYECEVSAGSMNCTGVSAQKSMLRCGIGNLDFTGSLQGKTNIDCGMGSVKMNLKGNISDYSYDLKLGLGDFKLNDDKKSGFCQVVNDERRENHISVNCGMGSVAITIK